MIRSRYTESLQFTCCSQRQRSHTNSIGKFFGFILVFALLIGVASHKLYIYCVKNPLSIQYSYILPLFFGNKGFANLLDDLFIIHVYKMIIQRLRYCFYSFALLLDGSASISELGNNLGFDKIPFVRCNIQLRFASLFRHSEEALSRSMILH